MALTDLTLSVTTGVQGRRFKSKISGLTTGKVEVRTADGSPMAGFGVTNGFLVSESLPAFSPVVAVLREFDPGAGTSVKDTRLTITSYGPNELQTQAAGALGGGRTMRGYRTGGVEQVDGSLAWSLYVEDDLGATQTLTAGVTTLAALSLSGVLTINVANTLNILGASPGSVITLQSGSLPAGMALNSAARTITGTPTSATTYTPTLRETLAGAVGSPKDTALSTTVLAALGPTTASFAVGATAGTKIADITGLGAGETVTAVAPNDGRIAIAGGGTAINVGLTASSAGTIGYTLTTSLGRTLGVAVTASAAAPLPTGFTLNGSTNPTLKSSLANAASNTSRSTWVVKGDSVPAGYGAGVTANGTSSTLAQQLAGARPYVPYKVAADLLTAAGFPALNTAAVCDNGVAQNGESTSAFDPRLVLGSGTSVAGGQGYAGGGFFVQDVTPTTFTPTEAVDTFVVYILNTAGALGFTIDGSPASGITASGGSVAGSIVTSPGTGAGFTRIVIPAGSLGVHTLGIRNTAGATTNWNTVSAYNSAVNAIDIFNHASGSALSTQQASSGNWNNNNFLAYQAPAFTIICVGLNDAFAGPPTTNFDTAMQTMIDTGKLSGDVLVLWANAANPGTFNLTNQNTFHDAAAAKAAANGVAFGDIRAALGDWAATAARTADNLVHPNRGYGADEAAYIVSCINYMRTH